MLQAWRILDFLQNYPESCHMLTWMLDEPGIPTDYRHMEGAAPKP
jgi:catalase